MKKITVILFTALLSLSVSTTAKASERFSTATENSASETDTMLPGGAFIGDESANVMPGGALIGDDGNGKSTDISPLDEWNQNGWPVDVSYACEVGGEMAGDDKTILYDWEIGVVNATEERKQEIKALFPETCRITFFDVRYSHAEREAVMMEIETEVKKNHDANFQYCFLIKNSEQIYIVVKDEAFEEENAHYTERYGNLVWVQKKSEEASFTYTTGMTETGLGISLGDSGISLGEDGNGKKNPWLIISFAGIFILAAAILFFSFIRKRFVTARQTSNGRIFTNDAPISRSQTIQAVKESNVTPRAEVLEKLQEKLDMKQLR